MIAKVNTRLLTFILALVLAVALVPGAAAKTVPAGQTVGTVLFYITNSKGEEILVSHISVEEMEADMAAGKIDNTLHNYSMLDRFVTTIHQEGQGFTVPEFIDYAKGKSSTAAIRSLPLALSGDSVIKFWGIDQTAYNDLDTYTYSDLYGDIRYNFPMMYEYWDYTRQDYYDPAGKMTRSEVIDYIFDHGEQRLFILAVRSYSQRYMVTDEKFGTDYNMENYWNTRSLLDNDRTIRMMKPMTKNELYDMQPTASDSRYWIANIRLDMRNSPNISPLGKVAAPTATMTENAANYYIRFSSATPDATILYNHNFASPNYTPTSPYGDDAVVVPKDYFKSGTVTMTARAIKDGYTDAGVITLSLKPSGIEENPESESSKWSDVAADTWYFDAVSHVMSNGLFDAPNGNFSPAEPMTREMFAIALYRHAGEPAVAKFADFTDVKKGTPLSTAVSWASNAGLVNGMGDGSFAPNSSITREQLAAMFYRYATHRAEDITVRGQLSSFSDAAKISNWATDAMSWCNGMKIINGMSDGTISPKGTATRAQVAQMLLNYSNTQH